MATTDLTTNLKALAASWKHLDALMSGKANIGVQLGQDISGALQELINQASALKSGIDTAVSAHSGTQKSEAQMTGELLQFKTAKGSIYFVQPNGQTLRDKAYRPEHGVAEQGVQPLSERTVYVTQEGLRLLGEFQRQMIHKKRIVFFDQQRMGIQLLSGDEKGKFRSVTPYSTTPEVGLTPVELWNDGNRVHFGNTIVEVTTAADAGRKLSPDGESRSASMRNVLSTCESRLMHEASMHGSPAQSSTGNPVTKGPR